MGYRSSLADPDVWLHLACKPNGYKYYEYLLANVDDILVLSHNPGKILAHLSEYYRLKDGYSKPERYLRAQVKEWCSPNDPTKTKWALSLEQYVKEAVKNV